MKAVVRILGGKYRGKNIHFPNEANLRPTPSRVRETLFNWLMHDVRDARCLDAFAGSGALGFEAFSRGAKAVTLLEPSRTVFLNLKSEASSFHSNAIEILQTEAERFLERTDTIFDIIFLDPPFNQPELLTTCIHTIEQNNILAPGGFMYTESEEPVTPTTEYWETHREKKAGQVVYALHQRRN